MGVERGGATMSFVESLQSACALGWIQCTQCGWGCEIHKSEVDAGDYVDRQACPDCGLGPCSIDWDYPWVAEEK